MLYGSYLLRLDGSIVDYRSGSIIQRYFKIGLANGIISHFKSMARVNRMRQNTLVPEATQQPSSFVSPNVGSCIRLNIEQWYCRSRRVNMNSEITSERTPADMLTDNSLQETLRLALLTVSASEFNPKSVEIKTASSVSKTVYSQSVRKKRKRIHNSFTPRKKSKATPAGIASQSSKVASSVSKADATTEQSSKQGDGEARRDHVRPRETRSRALSWPISRRTRMVTTRVSIKRFPMFSAT